MRKLFIIVFIGAAGLTSSALAHHPLGGETPQTLLHGLLSGIGHPLIGFDHLAFIVGVGLLAALRGLLFLPLGFVVGTLLGTLLILGGVSLPYVEVMISLSVLLVGIAVILEKHLSALPVLSLTAFAGLFHGWAYGEAVIGAEPTPIVAYLLGFGLTQLAIAFIAMASVWLSRRYWHQLEVRFAGAMVAGVGLTYLVELAESAIFAGI